MNPQKRQSFSGRATSSFEGDGVDAVDVGVG